MHSKVLWAFALFSAAVNGEVTTDGEATAGGGLTTHFPRQTESPSRQASRHHKIRRSVACGLKPSSAPSSARSSTAAGPKPSCSMQNEDPDQGINSAYCVCNSSKTLPLLTKPSTAMATESCDYPSIPGSSTIAPSKTLGPVTTNSAMCQICTPVVNNEDSCTTIKGCLPETARATVQAGSIPVHVGTLTGPALYTSISSALESLCPTVSQTQSPTACTTDKVNIKGIVYADDPADSLGTDGELVVEVEASSYNVTSLRDAMIKSAALTAQNSAAGKNCFNQQYTVEMRKRGSLESWLDPLAKSRRWLTSKLGLEVRDHPYPTHESMTMCNVGGFAGVQYYDPYWRLAPQPGPSDFIDASWTFKIINSAFECEFIEGLLDALAAVQPEFAVEDVELGEAIAAACEAGMDGSG